MLRNRSRIFLLEPAPNILAGAGFYFTGAGPLNILAGARVFCFLLLELGPNILAGAGFFYWSRDLTFWLEPGFFTGAETLLFGWSRFFLLEPRPNFLGVAGVKLFGLSRSLNFCSSS